MSWFVDSSLSFFQNFSLRLLKCGPIPKHIAFIMDGNRRFAAKKHVEKFVGHSKGFDKLSQTLQWCLELGVKEVTVYAFSIENFKRTTEEVEDLMKLATEKFRQLLKEKDRLMADGICVRAIGNLEMLSNELKKLISEAVLLTKENNKAILNIGFAYTSREEITNAIRQIVTGLQNGELARNDINSVLLSNCLYTSYGSNPDLLIRTSGEVRLSDFLLWQISDSVIYFTDVLWPEFTIWKFIVCIFNYQRSCKEIEENRIVSSKEECLSSSAEKFVNGERRKLFRQLQLYASG